MQRRVSFLLVLTMFLHFPVMSYAHQSETGIGTFYGGMLSPIFFADHLLLLLALAIVTIQHGNRVNRIVISFFTISLVVSTLVSRGVEASNSFYPLNLLLIFILGLFIALPGRLHVMLLSFLSVITGLFLGYDIVVKSYGAATGLPFLTGIVLMEFLLLTASTTWIPQKLLIQKSTSRLVANTVILGGGFILLLLYLGSDTSFSVQNLTFPSEESIIGMVKQEEMSILFISTTIFLSFLWGAGHALTPGHGKAIVAAYLIGARSTPWHALYLGLTVTITHTLGIFCLGFIALFASHYILPETLFPWLALISGLIVVVLGMSMLASRIRPLIGKKPHHHHHHHGEPHHTHKHSHHDHSHTSSHEHSHLPPENAPVSWKTILGLGISGGLLPCPSALVLLLAAISIQRIGFGMLLVFIFSVGLAAVLIAVGLLFIKGSHIIQKIPQASAVTRILPIISTLLILILGVFISVDALKSIYW